MAFCKKVLSILLFSQSLLASGMPVIDTSELLKQISEGLYLASSIDMLLSEAGADGTDYGAIRSLQSELQMYKGEIENFRALNGAVSDASDFPVERSKVFAKQIQNVTNHIRKVKRVVALATSFAARPAAISASLSVLKEQQEEDRRRTETALRVLEEKERIRLMRLELQKKKSA